ncbi:MAG: sigma-70 family RNA polymerase sigma factor [Pseudomonadota bacterium]
MSNNSTEDRDLAERCLGGSREAWDEFYARFTNLIRSVVRRYAKYRDADREELVQNVYLALVTALKTYDAQYPLSRFVCVVTERVCTDQYRMTHAAKRSGKKVPLDPYGESSEGAEVLASAMDDQETRLSRSQDKKFLSEALSELGEKCRELLKLRFYEEFPLTEIAQRWKVKANTLAVQTRRCLDQLRDRYQELTQEGPDR